MKCSQAKFHISWAMDEALPEYERARLESHLQACPACVAYKAQLERARGLLERAAAEPSENFEWKVQLKIQQALREAAARALPAPSRRVWLPVGASAAITAALVVTVGVVTLLRDTSIDAPALDPHASAVTDSGHDGSSRRSAARSQPAAVDRAAQMRTVAQAERRAFEPMSSQPGFAPMQVGVGDVMMPSASDQPELEQFLDPLRVTSRRQLEQQLIESQRKTEELRQLLRQLDAEGADATAGQSTIDSLAARASAHDR